MKQEEKIDRDTDRESTAATPRPEKEHTGGKPHFTEVENAHASGLGAMGRNDEKLPTGAETEPEQDDPAY